MRISELSALSGVSAASIKYYTREGLLPEGVRTGYNQTEYGESHLARLRLIRALLEAGGLSVSATQRVLSAVDDEALPLHVVFGIAQHAIPQRETPPSKESVARIERVMTDRGWSVFPGNPGVTLAAGILDTYETLGRGDLASELPRYAAAAGAIAEADLDMVEASGSRGSMAETVVIGTVLGDALVAGLRRIAQESLSRQRYPMPNEEQS